MTGTGFADLLGLLAGGFVLLTFSVRSLTALRSFAVVSNLLFISYALAAQLMPIALLHGLLLPLNLFRLREQLSAKRVTAACPAATPPADQVARCLTEAARRNSVRTRRRLHALRGQTRPASQRERRQSAV